MKTRLRKAECPNCGYIIRLARLNIDRGLPSCPCGTQMIATDRVEPEFRRPRDTGLVYFLQVNDDGPIKIGWTGDTEKFASRRSALQTGCPWPLQLVGTAPGTHDLERALHKRYKPLHMQGEWFFPSAELLALAMGSNHTCGCGRSPDRFVHLKPPFVGFYACTPCNLTTAWVTHSKSDEDTALIAKVFDVDLTGQQLALL